jgi:glucose-6-phosphate dehydrogenase assembly protein OpcA
VSEDVWSAQDTTPDAIEAALREMLRERHAANEALAPARVLNLVVVVDRDWKGEISNRLERVGRYHASRTVLCTVEEGRDRLDATAVMAYDEPRNGGVGVMREQVEIDLGPEHLERLLTIVDPVLVSEIPTVMWAPHGHEEAARALLSLIDVMLLDSDDLLEPDAALARAGDFLGSAYVVDLAWLRTTPWRERVAASFDQPKRRALLKRIGGIAVRHRPSSRASALLMAGWLASRLHWDVEPLELRDGEELHGGAAVAAESVVAAESAVAAEGASEVVAVELNPIEQEAPGLAGVTITCRDGFELSLDRAPGGLRAHEAAAGEEGRSWRVLGASRGEGGILGEGVRQALLRDPTYGPALEVARRFCQ